MHSKVTKIILGTIGVVLLIAAPLVITDRYVQHIMVLSGVYVLLAVSWNLLTGFAGQLNLGHAAFFGIGAYASALISMHFHLSPWLGLLCGGLVASIFGGLLGIPSFRLSGPFLAITTIGFSEITRMVAMNWVGLTRGSLGLYGIPPLTPIKLGQGTSIEFTTEFSAYYVILALIFIIVYVVSTLHRSEFGLTVESLREDEMGAESIGINTSHYKLAVFMISAFIAGTAGAFYAHYERLISPNMLSTGVTFSIITMVMVGGIGTIWGPIIGAVVLTFLSEGLRFVEEAINLDIRMIIYGVVLALVILFMRQGLVGVLSGLGRFISRNPERQT
ncbi:MAG TPA: branched-chain amino acid ABC transporter permease [Deltaproteobacteria bacterium]|nr:branched-chain amino acid ABC transporter permease [Deltaproteobacteria bacterium]HPR55237.1 branched-chain amino acid ABC transporter permease [Deltaproteobacteria bacterium]HXK46874.1 branched-chain amino acid ABC transporter permease [Deltaproteobacteria bacterium]